MAHLQRRILLPLLTITGFSAAAAVTSAPIHVRAPNAETRIWQARPPLEAGEVKWRWDGADAVRLTVTSVVARTVLLDRAEFAAASGEAYGTWTLPVTAPGETALYDLVLERFASGTARDTHVARVVVLPEGLSLPVPGSKEWRTLDYKSAAPFAYDAAWTNLSGAASLALVSQQGAVLSLPLAGSSGFDAFHALACSASPLGSRFTARLSFGGTVAYAADLAFPAGACIILR